MTSWVMTAAAGWRWPWPRGPMRPWSNCRLSSSTSPGGSFSGWCSSARADRTRGGNSPWRNSFKADDPQASIACYAMLIDHRLLTPSLDDRLGRRVDIADEMLIIGWPASREWSGPSDAEQTRGRLEVKAEELVLLGRGGGLLDKTELPEAERWLRLPGRCRTRH